VANFHGHTASVFTPGATTPTATLTGLSLPGALAFDAHGNLFVANEGNDTVKMFAPAPAAGGVVMRTALPSQPINVGAASGTGVNLSDAELAQIFTTAGGTVTFGDPTQTGNITFADATPASTPGASVVVLQAPTGPGAIILDSTAGTALAAGSGNVSLSAGSGGIVAIGDATNPSIASSGQVSLDATGGIGAAADPIGFEPTATATTVTVGTSSVPGRGVYLGGQGALTLGAAQTANLAPLVVTAGDLTVAGNLSAGDITVDALDLTVNAGTSVTAGADKTLAIQADTLDLLGTLSAGDINLNALALTVAAGASVIAGAGDTVTVQADTLDLLGTLSAGSTGQVTVTPLTVTRNIDLGGTGPATDLVISDSALGRVTAGTLRIGDATFYLGDITVTGDVTRHAGYDTLSLQTTQGTTNTAARATLAVANLALQAGTGIGTTGRMAIDATHLAFASQSGPIQLHDARAVKLIGVDTLPASSIPPDVFSAPQVGDVYTLLSSDAGISGQVTYQGDALAEGATLTLADGHRYQISYKGGKSGHDVTLTRIADPASVPPTLISYSQATTNLQTQVDAAGLAHGMQSSLHRQLQAASAFFAAGDTADGVRHLQSFIHHLSAQSGKRINSTLANAWIADAQEIISAVG
jgi:hypothetical protein